MRDADQIGTCARPKPPMPTGTGRAAVPCVSPALISRRGCSPSPPPLIGLDLQDIADPAAGFQAMKRPAGRGEPDRLSFVDDHLKTADGHERVRRRRDRGDELLDCGVAMGE